MKILLFGKNGQLGQEFQRLLPQLGETICFDRENLDICDIQALQNILDELKPNLIVNASAYTAVDRAETEQDIAMNINALAPGTMAEWARKSHAGFIHYSTDYVFNGKKGSPYIESDSAAPLNMYGKSKLAGEENIKQVGDAYLILRTSWVYSMQGNGFISKVLEWARTNTTLKIVNDQISNPTWARALAEATSSLVNAYRDNLQDVMKEKCGVYHLAGTGYTSRFAWATQILANASNRTDLLAQTIEPVSSEEFPLPATRPLFSALDCSKFAETFNIRLPKWDDSLQDAMSE